MHIEVQVALNFVISYLYNKLPRRRVNIFGEELEKALKEKFRGHWYPEKPFKGSAFRCMKTGDPVDPVFEIAARESGVPIQDILENLPTELAVWVDPGEVSYRIGEKNAVKILYSENGDPQDDNSADREVTKTFNPEAQCFQPIDAVTNSLNGLNISPKSSMTQINGIGNVNVSGSAVFSGNLSSSSSTSSPTSANGSSTFKNSPSPIMSFLPRSTTPLTFTTAAFAQTKFGSTKLKTSSKRTNRMSPTEFSNYIRQKAIQQQMHHHNNQQHHQQHHQQQQQHLYNNGLNGQSQPLAMIKNQMHKPAAAATVVATNLASRSMSPMSPYQSQHPHNHLHPPHHHHHHHHHHPNQTHGNQNHHHGNLSNGLKTNNYDSPYFFAYPQANTSATNYSTNPKNVFDTAIPSSSNNAFFTAPEFYNQHAPQHHYHNQQPQPQPQHHHPNQQHNNRLSRSFFDPNLSFSLNGMVAASGISDENTLINSTETTDNNNNTDKLLEGYNMNTYKQLLLAN